MIWFICIVKSVDEVEWPNKLLLVLDIQILEIIPVDLTVGWKKPHNWVANESSLAMTHYYWLINQLWFIEMDKEQSNTSENFISVKQLRLRYWDKNVFLECYVTVSLASADWAKVRFFLPKNFNILLITNGKERIPNTLAKYHLFPRESVRKHC